MDYNLRILLRSITLLQSWLSKCVYFLSKISDYLGLLYSWPTNDFFYPGNNTVKRITYKNDAQRCKGLCIYCLPLNFKFKKKKKKLKCTNQAKEHCEIIVIKIYENLLHIGIYIYELNPKEIKIFLFYYLSIIT